MAKGAAKQGKKPEDAPKASKSSAGSKAKAPSDDSASAAKVGPPALVLALGFVSVLVSLPLLSADGIGPHIVGYVTGALIPIVIVGLVRKIDLGRRRSPNYEPKGWFPPAIVVLAIAAVVAAGLHVWPIATELAS